MSSDHSRTYPRVPEQSGTFRSDWKTLGEVRDGSGTQGEVQAGSGDPRGGLGRVRGPSRRSETGRMTFEEIRDGSWD